MPVQISVYKVKRKGIKMKLSELLENIDVLDIKGVTDMNISGITFNSKEVKPGYLFVCIKGFTTDGHSFARNAIDAGAVAILAEHFIEGIDASTVVVKDTRAAAGMMTAKFYDYPFRKFRLIGVTGTNGKTTTTYLVKSILEDKGYKVGLIGTNQNLIGNKVIPAERTTPDFIELMQLFNQFAEEGADFVVMEVSSHSLALDRVTACEYEVGAFTNITQDHLDFHKTMENYLEAKSKLFKICEKGVINNDIESADYLKKNADCGYITYGKENEADLKAENIVYTSKGIEFDAKFRGETEKITLPIPGEFSVYNALTAIGICLSLGLSLSDIAKGLSEAKGVKGRIEVVPTDTDYTVIIDYAHTPDGILNIINAIRGFAKGRIITLFGCGGDRDRTKRPLMGKVAGELSDFCIVTSDNPRTEEPGEIIKDILPGIDETGCEYVVIENRFEAIGYALDMAEKDDIVLLAGKGHETYQILKDRTITFDEREIVSKLIDFSEK